MGHYSKLFKNIVNKCLIDVLSIKIIYGGILKSSLVSSLDSGFFGNSNINRK